MARKDVQWADLKGETIVSTAWGNKELPNGQYYGVMTLCTKSGREFVVTQCMGEVQLTEVVKE
jgi:hypothetical protein